MFKFTESRVRFLNGNADKSSIPSEFHKFPHTIDTFIATVEPSVRKNKRDLLKKKRHFEDDETEAIQHTMKKTRIADIYEDIEKKTPEDQIRF
ncbi:hypothetical protein CaCOL14_010726 [Colletotrichum acutatum]